MLCLLLEHGRFNWTVDHIEWIEQMLQICLVDFGEEIFYALVVAIIMDHEETYLAGCDEGRHKPLIEFIDGLQVHIVGAPFVLE